MRPSSSNNSLLSSLSTSVMQGNKKESIVTSGAGDAVSKANLSRRVHPSSPMQTYDEKQRIRHSNNSPVAARTQSPRPMNPPIMEGYDNAPSAYIAANGAGYDNQKVKAIKQMAKNIPTGSVPRSYNPNFQGDNFRSSGVKDYRYGLSKGKLQV